MEALLTDVDRERIRIKLKELEEKHRPANAIKKSYFEAKNKVQDLGISVPSYLRGLKQAIGWCNIAITTLNSRIDFQGWYETENDFGLKKVYDDNYLETEASLFHQDLLVYGVGFILTSAGDMDEGEPEVLITAESPNNVSVEYSLRSRRVNYGIIVTDEEDHEKFLTYVTRDLTVPVRVKGGEVIELEGGFYHGLGRCPIVMAVNRGESNREAGHSEITEPMMSLTQSMGRTMLEAEIAREFFAAPQKYILGATEEMFKGKEGENVSKLQILMDKVLVLTDDEYDTGAETGGLTRSRVDVGQFTANDPSVFTVLMQEYAKQFAAYAFVPQDYLGLATVNPSSADAIRAAEGRLIDKAKGIMRGLKKPWAEVAELAVLTRDGELPENWERVPTRFRDMSTPARTATADEISKLISARVVKSDSEIVYNRLDLSNEERDILRTENTVAGAQSILGMLAGGGTEDDEDVDVSTETPIEKAA